MGMAATIIESLETVSEILHESQRNGCVTLQQAGVALAFLATAATNVSRLGTLDANARRKDFSASGTSEEDFVLRCCAVRDKVLNEEGDKPDPRPTPEPEPTPPAPPEPTPEPEPAPVVQQKPQGKRQEKKEDKKADAPAQPENPQPTPNRTTGQRAGAANNANQNAPQPASGQRAGAQHTGAQPAAQPGPANGTPNQAGNHSGGPPAVGCDIDCCATLKPILLAVVQAVTDMHGKRNPPVTTPTEGQTEPQAES